MSSAGVTSAEVWKSWTGRVVDGKFPLRQWLGGSDHSAVFLTERPGQSSQKAALKLIAADAGDADRQLARWHAAAQLIHPHLIRIFEAGHCGQTLLYAVMEYAEEDLSQILPQRALSPAEVKDLLPPVLDALSYLHSKGLVHGRIRPSNVLAVGDQLKLSADQVASSSEINSSRRRRDVYDAPERAAGIVSVAGDLWSVGVTLVAALTQNIQFVGEAEHGGPKLPDSIPQPFRSIAAACLQLDPRRRCSIADIQSLLRPSPQAAQAVSLPEETAATPRSSRRGLIAAIVLAAAVLIGIMAFYPRQKTSVDNTRPSHAEQPVAQPEPKPVPSPAPEPAKAVSTPNSGAEVVHKVLPDVSRSARNTITGTIKVSVRAEVNPSGKVSQARLVSPGPSKYFARLSLQAAERWEFSSANNSSIWLLHFHFRRKSTEATAERVNR